MRWNRSIIRRTIEVPCTVACPRVILDNVAFTPNRIAPYGSDVFFTTSSLLFSSAIPLFLREAVHLKGRRIKKREEMGGGRIVGKVK